MHVLIVDDVAETRQLFAWAFGLQGHTSHMASNGVEAVTLVQTVHYDAIVMDIKMPEMDGLEAIRQIRQLFSDQPLPIVVLTSDREEECRVAAMQAGANTVIYKPILPFTVLRRVEECRREMRPPYPAS